jgi:CHAT domain-containing protein
VFNENLSAGRGDMGHRRWRLMFAGLVGLLLLLLPLSDTGYADPQAQYDSAKQLFLRGYLEKSQQEAAWGYARSKPYSREWAARFRLLEAQAMIWRGMYQDGLGTLTAEPAILDSAGDRIERLTLEGTAYTHLHQFSLADQRFSQAESLCAVSPVQSCGAIDRARGVLAFEHGDFTTARRWFLESLSFARTHQDRLQESNAYVNLGVVALQESHYDEAVDWSKQAYAAATELSNENLAQISIGNLGWAYFGLGDADRALELFNDAEQRAAKLGSVGAEEGWLTTAANVYGQRGDFARATESLNKALALARQINSKEDIVDSLEDLAHTSIDAGKIDDAAAYVEQVDPMVRASGNRLDILDVQLAQARIDAARHQDQEAETLFRAVEHDPDSQTSMRLGAEHELARLYEAQLNTAQADHMYRTSLGTFEEARAELKSEDSKLPFLTNANGIYDDYIHFLVQGGRAEEALAIADQSRARTLAQGLLVNSSFRTAGFSTSQPNAVARRMNATLLFYWLGEKQSYLWAITPKVTKLFTLPGKRDILPAVERYRKALLDVPDPIESANADGVALYQTLVAPAADLITPGSTVVLLDDGPLSQLNFETLIVPGASRHYWIEDETLVSAPSLNLLASAKPAEKQIGKLLLVGDAVSPGPDYPELPMAATEMKLIEQHFPTEDETVFERQQANATSYFESAPQRFDYIHFVAHGVASRTDPLDSAIILSRSSAEEDSFKLYARDIIQHPIHARLVTVTACYGSGTRSYAGEGTVGLAWAFLRAGAHNVISALWEVSDTSTPRLMSELYQGIQNGSPPSAALRNAKLALLHSQNEYRRPFYWAPLQIYTGL